MRKKDIAVNNGKCGFTLLELLTVMAIMVIMMSIAGASYYGMSQGAAMRGSVAGLTTTLSLARQYAVNHRSRTYVCMWNEGETNYHQVFIDAGLNRNTGGNELLHIDDLGFENGILVGGSIFKAEDGEIDISTGTAIVTENTLVETYMEIKGTNVLDGSDMIWPLDSRAAWPLQDRELLAAGIEYPSGTIETVMFMPNGTKGGTTMVPFTINITEVRSDIEKTVTVTLFGKVSAE